MLVYPKYDGESLLNIPSTIIKIFGGVPTKPTLPQNYFQSALGSEKLILFLFDGFGHNIFKNEAIKYPFFKNLSEYGFYAPITTVFPSTTAAAINTINSGLSPLEHGLPEWYVYFQELGIIMQTLPFVPLFAKDTEKVKAASAEILLSAKTIYEQLSSEHVSSYIFLNKNLVNSFYNQKASAGATLIPYSTLAEMVVTLRNMLTSVEGKAYFYVYYSAIDAAEHLYGIWNDQVRAEVSNMAYMLQTELIEKTDKVYSRKTSLMLSADHGQISIDPARTIYLDEIRGVKSFLKYDLGGSVLIPTGSSRDLFLYIRESKMKEALPFFKKCLEGKANVYTMQEVVEKGWFGMGNMHQEFLNRIGNILILPIENNTVSFHYDDTGLKFLGVHGGLTEDEMLIPFGCARLADLAR